VLLADVRPRLLVPPGWVAALAPLSEDGMIVAAPITLLADSRPSRNGGMLPSGGRIADRYGRHERWGRLSNVPAPQAS